MKTGKELLTISKKAQSDIIQKYESDINDIVKIILDSAEDAAKKGLERIDYPIFDMCSLANEHVCIVREIMFRVQKLKYHISLSQKGNLCISWFIVTDGS